MPKNSIIVNVVDGKPLTIGGVTTISNELPTAANNAQGLIAMHLYLNVTTVPGTAIGSFTDGLLRLIQQITHRTDRDGISHAAPGRPLFVRAACLSGGEQPDMDLMTVAAGTFRVHIPLLFSDPRTIFMEDTTLDLRRYASQQLEISLGTASNLWSVPGTGTFTATLDVDLELTDSSLSEQSPQMAYPYVVTRGSTLSSVGSVLLENAPGMSYKRLWFISTDSGNSWDGTVLSTVIGKWSITDLATGLGLNNCSARLTAARKNLDYAVDKTAEAVVRQCGVHDWITRTGSIRDSLSGNRSGLRLKWDLLPSAPTGNIHMMIDAIRELA